MRIPLTNCCLDLQQWCSSWEFPYSFCGSQKDVVLYGFRIGPHILRGQELGKDEGVFLLLQWDSERFYCDNCMIVLICLPLFCLLYYRYKHLNIFWALNYWETQLSKRNMFMEQANLLCPVSLNSFSQKSKSSSYNFIYWFCDSLSFRMLQNIRN